MSTPSSTQLFYRALRSTLASCFGGFGYFESAFGDGAFVVEESARGRVGPAPAAHRSRLEVRLVGAGNIRALHPQQKLAFLHGVAQPGLDLDDASGRQRDHRNGARDVGLTTPVTFSAGTALYSIGGRPGGTVPGGRPRSCWRPDRVRPGRRRSLGLRIWLAFPAANQLQPSSRYGQLGEDCEPANLRFHGITSRPTARFS